MQLGTSVILLFAVFLTRESIADIVFVAEGHLQGQTANFKSKNKKTE